MPQSGKMVCVFCETGESGEYDFTSGSTWFNCERCGQYFISPEAMDIVKRLPARDRWDLAGVVREKSDLSKTRTTIGQADIPALLTQAPNSFDVAAKARKLLNAVARRSKYAGDAVSLPFDSAYPLAYVGSNSTELIYVCRYLIDLGWATSSGHLSAERLTLTPKGWEATHEQRGVDSEKAFVAMWFDASMTPVFTEGIAAAICDDSGYRPVRIDLEEHNDDIVDRVIAEINESRFVVADLTGSRNGVYFEAGYAKGLGLPVIWTCRTDWADKCHFDVEHQNQIRWDTSEELRGKLQARIRATIGLGPLANTRSMGDG